MIYSMWQKDQTGIYSMRILVWFRFPASWKLLNGYQPPLLHSGRKSNSPLTCSIHNRNPWKLKTKISQHVNTSRTSRHNPQINRTSHRNIFNGNSCLVLLLNKFPASCELLRVLPALGFCFDLSLCNLHLLIMRLILFPRIVSNSIKIMYNISSD